MLTKPDDVVHTFTGHRPLSDACHTHQHDLTTLLGSKNGQLRTGYDRSTIKKINFDGINFKKHLLDPRPGSVHPALQY